MISQSAIARKLNLSQRTVSLCLAGSDRVAEQTRRRVIEVAQELGYRPNRSAIAMRSGRFNSVALLQSTRPGFSYLPDLLLVGLQEGISKREMHLVIGSVPDEKLTDGQFLPTVLREWSVDGFLVNYNYGFSPRLVEVIEENHLPSIWLNTKRPHDCAYPDDIDAARRITERLLEAGHKRIAFFSQRRFDEHYSVRDRFDGYEQAMHAAGLQSRKLAHLDADGRDWANAVLYIRSFLNEAERPTAVVAYESFEATRVMLVAAGLGMEVPRDLSLATFHERGLSQLGFPITTFEIPESDLGMAALEMLLRKVEGGETHLAPRVVQYQSISGDSIAPPRS